MYIHIHAAHQQLTVSCKLLVLPLHLLFTHLLHTLHIMELQPTLFMHAAGGHLPFSLMHPLSTLLTIILFFPAVTIRPKTIPSFCSVFLQYSLLTCYCQQQNIYIQQLTQESIWDVASSAVMNSKGLKIQSWSTPTYTLGSSLSIPFTLTDGHGPLR